MNRKLTQLSASLLLALPIFAFAQAHGGGGPGGPPAGVGGGMGAGMGGGMGNAGGVAGGIGGSIAGGAGGHVPDITSLGGSGMSKTEAHRLEMQAKRDAAAAKAAQAQAQGAAHANANAAFGQSTAATARTLKDADAATRAAFHDTVTAGAKLQGKGDKSGSDDAADSDTSESTEIENAATAAKLNGKASATGSAQTGADHANANAQFGQDTAAQARTLKDADAATRQAFGGTVSGSAKLKSADKKTAKATRTR